MKFSVAVFFVLLGSLTAVSADRGRHYDDLSTPLMASQQRSKRMTTESRLEIRLVPYNETYGDRVKRATWRIFKRNWPRRIPFKFHPSFLQEYKQVVKDAMSEIMDRVCVEWKEEPDFSQHENSYDTKAYLEIKVTGRCGARLGRGEKDEGRRVLSFCPDYESVLYTLIRSLGSIYEARGPLRDNYMTVAENNLVPDSVVHKSLKGSYSNIEIVSEEFDASSIMRTGESTWSVNGLDIILPYRKDQFSLNRGQYINLENNYFELNQVYRCEELCDDKVDCGEGYYGFSQGACRCFCPHGFDFSENCTTLEDESSGPKEWPDTSFFVNAYDNFFCPLELIDIIFVAAKDPNDLSDALHLCQKTSNSSRGDMSIWPKGDYCIYTPGQCMNEFKEQDTKFSATRNWQIRPKGRDSYYSLFSTDFADPLKVKLCCRSDRVNTNAIELPRRDWFGLPVPEPKCSQTVKGMRYELKTEYVKVPEYVELIPLYACEYGPAQYGCNRHITFKDGESSVSVETPGFQKGKKESNTRCLFYFNPGEGNRVKITINTLDIDSDDYFAIRRFNKWSLPQLDFEENFKPEFISETNFLFIEYWSASRESNKKGVSFTAKVLLGENLCYDAETRGVNYVGQKQVTEDFEECLPWSDALDCPDFQDFGSDFNIGRTAILDLVASTKACRNPGGVMGSPFCYTSVTRGMCRKAFCDVCNDLDGLDQLNNCQDLIDNDDKFCTSALQRYQCSKSCGLVVWEEPNTTYCSTPSGPVDGVPTQNLKEKYNVGDIVSFQCNQQQTQQTGTAMRCTEKGWTEPGTACGCKAGWRSHGDRCLHLYDKKRRMKKASDVCGDLGGRLMIVRNKKDLATLNEIGSGQKLWINIKYKKTGGPVLFTDQSVPAPFTPRRIVVGRVRKSACEVYVARSHTARWKCDSRENFVCEMFPDKKCSDSSPMCVEALKQDPELCSKESRMMTTYCRRSCGICQENNGVCANPKGHNTMLVSPIDFDSIRVGQTVEHVCFPGTNLLEGNLKRIVGYDGQVLGKEPACTSAGVPINVGMEEVLPRSGVVPLNKTFLIDSFGFRIPTNGNISHWHLYGVKKGQVELVVYRRQNIEGSLGKVIGYNTINIDTINLKWTVPVPSNEQIQVEVGDLYGIFTKEGLIAANLCNDKSQKLITLRTGEGSPEENMSDESEGLNSIYCMFLSLGVKVEPTTITEDIFPRCAQMKKSNPLFCVTGQRRKECLETCSRPPREKRCKDEENYGMTYMGDRQLTARSNPCIPWKNAIGCNFFPYDDPKSPDVEKDSNKCRNRGGLLSRPWCFVDVEPGKCSLDYCDVCPYRDLP